MMIDPDLRYNVCRLVRQVFKWTEALFVTLSRLTREGNIPSLISHLKRLSTSRLQIEDWERVLEDPIRRSELEHALVDALRPQTTRFLPLSMQFSEKHTTISKWISDRVKEADVLCVSNRTTDEFSGLILLHKDPEVHEKSEFQLGYFFREDDWGKGYATEAIRALVSALGSEPSIRVLAGVDNENLASARVLEKSGFTKLTDKSTASRQIFEFCSDA